MSLSLNQTLCIQCGQCVKVCPVSILVRRSKNIIIKNNRLSHCLHCGHCVAIWPRSALTLDLICPDLLQKATKPSLSDQQRTMLFKSRRSIRFYKEQSISFDILNESSTKSHTEGLFVSSSGKTSYYFPCS